jgi:hypothetical protein
MIPEVGAAIIDAQTRARAAGSTTPLHVCWVAPRAAEDIRTFGPGPALVQMDVNPLIANSGSFTIVDARMHIGLPRVQP